MASRQRLKQCTARTSFPTWLPPAKQQRLRTLGSSSTSHASTSQQPPQRSSSQPIRLSTHFSPTQKASQSSSSSSTSSNDDPLPSLQLLLRGGYIRSSSSGVFTLLPNALRIIRKITNIIDQELTAISASRLAMPNLLPSKLWHQTGRYAVMGSELYKLRDRKDSEFVLGPTHEEEITKLVAQEVDSDRQLPLRLYQITTKFRDEPRPRMGLLRTKEFLMKDLYSFDKSACDAIATYEEVRGAYVRIFDRIFGAKGQWKAAEADTGAIGGNKSHEYHVQDPAGEDTLISCSKCTYTANTEKAVSMPDQAQMPVAAADVSVLLFGCRDVKMQDQVMHAFVLPATRTLNHTKLEKLVTKLNASTGNEAEQDRVELLYNSAASPVANAGAAGWDWKDRPEGPLVRFTSLSVLADFECASLDPSELNDALIHAVNTFTSRPGGNSNQHLPLIDLFPTQFGHFASTPSAVTPPLTLVDIRTAQATDTCPSCKFPASLVESKAIEVGHTFYLGDRYSRTLEAGFHPSNEVAEQTQAVEKLPNGRIPFQMGCYGIGVSRILGALAQKASGEFDRILTVEDAVDKKKMRKAGFVWPESIAPFTAVVMVSDGKDTKKLDAAYDVWSRIIAQAQTRNCSVRSVFQRLVAGEDAQLDEQPQQETGWSNEELGEVVIDDRAKTLGSKLADSDLTGYAYRVIVGKHWEKEGKVEVQWMAEGGWRAMVVPVEAFSGFTG
ncbi:potential proline-tRNA synthetase fragment [Pseudozyma hubeiensis SY62]|uniref:proline--tRNA ligase n=1 Tax=Pseudozyma hubeiensis (strain SY62) TaxID=1305764 RepID=R9P1N1_PSEHS|nr:potential proline-tRNA synthetase fragment [Pseudozyma hubeiensis SY62]GAC95052.1 potential proline-tRNA synthetase fragment [Pseudozyma hubeiensis SY62]